jgi:hypothetical protein
MPDLLPALLAEQERLRPMLDRLLALAALWVDPVVPGEGPAEPGGANALRFADPGRTGTGAVATGTAASHQATGPEVGATPFATFFVDEAFSPALPYPAATVDRFAQALGGGSPAADRPTLPEAPDADASHVKSRASPAMPVASLGRLRARVAEGGAAAKRTASLPPSVASPAAWSSPFASLSAGAAFAPGPSMMSADAANSSVAQGPAVMAVGAASSGAGAALPSSSWPTPTGSLTRAAAMAGGIAAWTDRGGNTVGDLATLPGDALEERLADILERAAAEAGIALP